MRKPLASLLITTLIITALLIAASCGGSGTTTPAGTTTTTPATSSEIPIPSDYKTYTSEDLFSISYPPDWELPLMAFFEEKEAKELIAIIESGSPVAESIYVFYAGVSIDETIDPFVAIYVDKSPVVNQTLDSIVEEMFSSYKDRPSMDYIEFSRVKTTVGGREVVIIDFQMVPVSAETPSRYLVMFTLAGKTSWEIWCLTSPEIFSNYEEDLYAIVNSLRILIQ